MYAQIMAMSAGRGIDRTPSFSAPPTCPLYQGPALYLLMPAHALTAGSPKVRADFASAPVLSFERIAVFSTPSRAYAGRGPPASNPS
jgi:hypothetical protein